MILAPLAVVCFAPFAIYPRLRQRHIHCLALTQTQIQIHNNNGVASHHRLSSTTSGGNSNNSINDDIADDLTKEELLLRLSETLAYYRERPEEGMTQSAVCLKILSTRLPNLHLNRSFVAVSTIPNAGYGLFASRDINDGELITLFPGDAVLSKSEVEEEGKKTAGPICSIMFGAHTKLEDRDIDRVLTHEARGYEAEVSAFTSIIGDRSIGFDNMAYNGHFANDGGYLKEFDDTSRRAYQKETLERYNAANFVMEGAHMGTVATKPIEKGAEVFLSYGEGYWLSRSDPVAASKTQTDILVEIERSMEERRKIKRATTLTALGVGRNSDEMSGAKSNDGKGRKKKKKKKMNFRSNRDTTKGFGI